MIDGGGAEHNDSKSYLKIEISEKKRGEFVCFLMESVRLLLLSLGGARPIYVEL